MRTIEISGLSEEVMSQLDKRARQVGVAPQVYARRLIERAVSPPGQWASLNDILAPVHDYTEALGITDVEIEELLSHEISEARQERRKSVVS